MSSNKGRNLRNVIKANYARCGCGDKNPSSQVFQPRPRPRPKPKTKPPYPQKPTDHCYHHEPRNYSSSSINSSDQRSGGGDDQEEDRVSTTTFSFTIDSSKSPRSTKISDSVAVVKDSYNPYLDFRQSMLQMISERKIDSEDDLRELLNCFLELNSPAHHEIIRRAFTEICNGLVSSSNSSTSSSHARPISQS